MLSVYQNFAIMTFRQKIEYWFDPSYLFTRFGPLSLYSFGTKHKAKNFICDLKINTKGSFVFREQKDEDFVSQRF